MIIENSLQREGFGYARLLLAAHHQDSMVLSTDHCIGYTQLVDLWGYSTVDVHEYLSGWSPFGGSDDSPDLVKAFDLLFPNLRSRMWAGHVNPDYNADPDQLHALNIWLVQGNLQDLLTMWRGLFEGVASGPQGGDDETFDYWPSAWGVCLHFTEDLIVLGAGDHNLLGQMQDAWDRMVAAHVADPASYFTDAEHFTSEVVPRPVVTDMKEQASA